MTKTYVRIHDATLRDGQHAVRHQLGRREIEAYAKAAEDAGIDELEVGHGNGLGASSLHIGQAAISDREMLVAARAQLCRTKLCAFMAPGWATRHDILAAREAGVDIVRIAAHCTEADVTLPYIRIARENGLAVQGVLLMSHMASPAEIARQCALMANEGADDVGFLDSAGALLPADVEDRTVAIRDACTTNQVIFHAHDNLGLSAWNSAAAVIAGATVVDACAGGFGAGAGNASVEQCIALLDRLAVCTSLTVPNAIGLGLAASRMIAGHARVDPVSVASGVAGVFSGFREPVLEAATHWGVSAAAVFAELGRMGALAGQEDLIVIAARRLAGEARDGE